MDVKITGLQDLTAKMRAMGPKVTKRHARRGTRQGAAKIRDAIKLTAPIRSPDDKTRSPGGLRRNVIVRSSRPKSSGVVVGSVAMRTEGDANDPKNAFYWRFVEYGTKHMPAQPFVAVTSRRLFRTVVKVVLREIDTGIEKDLAKATRSKT